MCLRYIHVRTWLETRCQFIIFSSQTYDYSGGETQVSWPENTVGIVPATVSKLALNECSHHVGREKNDCSTQAQQFTAACTDTQAST